MCPRCAELALPPAGLLSQSLEFSSPADNYTVCEGDNATLRYGDSDLPETAVLPSPSLWEAILIWAQLGTSLSGEASRGMDSGPRHPCLPNGWKYSNHCVGHCGDLSVCPHTPS